MRRSRPLGPGDTLGKYEIVREIATGGMATIYLARIFGTAGFEKSVVLKCILPGLAADAQFVQLFLDEARLAAQLRHSNIADVFDVGAEGDTYFFAMEYVNGENARHVRLKAKERDLQIPLEVSLAIVAGTAAALHYAHSATGSNGPLYVVHRDISPSNILVSFEGAIKLVDFGIARASTRQSRTRTGLRKGKVPYLSPEQCKGQSLDRRSDLFSLGTVLYELTTGMRPFRGTSDFIVMDQIVTCDPEPPSIVVPGYPRELELIVTRLLARDPDARFQSAGELLEAIEAFVTTKRMLTSAHVVARYMHELYTDPPTTPFERDTYTGLLQGKQTREYPGGKPPTGLTETLVRTSDEEPTAAFRRAEQLWTTSFELLRAPRKTGEAAIPSDEASQTTPLTEPTHQDVVLPFDPIAARSSEILDDIDAGAPARETAEQAAQRRIPALLDSALRWVDSGELDKAVTAVELALDEGTQTSSAHELLQANVDTIVTVYEAMLEDPYRTFELARSLQDLAGVAIDPSARQLLALVDGKTTITELIERSEMQRLEAYHHLCQLVLRGVVR